MGRLALVTLALVVPLVASAEDDIEMEPDPPPPPQQQQPAAPGKDPKMARKWLETAKQLVGKGDAATRAKKPDEAAVQYENAITAYEKAIETGGDVNLWFELATFEERIGKLDRAATHFRTVTKAQGARADHVKKATARYDDLTSKTGLVMIIAKPEGTVITIDGVELGKTPLTDPLILMPNTYKIALSADGFVTKEVDFQVEAGSESERTVELEAGESIKPKKKRVEEAPIEAPPPVDEPVQQPNKLPMYIGAGAAGGLLLIATITGLSAVSKHGTFEDENASPGDRRDAKDSGKTLALVTDLCLVGTLAAGGFTAYWYFFKYKPAQRKLGAEQQAKTQVVPWVQPDAGGFVVAGSF